jgi:hypothetical protein
MHDRIFSGGHPAIFDADEFVVILNPPAIDYRSRRTEVTRRLFADQFDWVISASVPMMGINLWTIPQEQRFSSLK